MLEVKNIYCGYDNSDIVKNISFKVECGNNICIVGPNGCGKSTLLKAIANLLEYRGEITLNNKNIKQYNIKELATKIALMKQSTNVYMPYTVYDTVALGRYAYLKGVFSTLNKEDEEIVNNCIEKVGLLEIKEKLITELSGGQLQRVYLARCFAQNPEVILLDEPTNHLDLKYQIELLEYLRVWARENNKIIVAVLHDLNLVHAFADKVMLINSGNIILEGTPKEVLNGEKLEEVYGVDIKGFMLDALNKWNS